MLQHPAHTRPIPPRRASRRGNPRLRQPQRDRMDGDAWLTIPGEHLLHDRRRAGLELQPSRIARVVQIEPIAN